MLDDIHFCEEVPFINLIRQASKVILCKAERNCKEKEEIRSIINVLLIAALRGKVLTLPPCAEESMAT